MTRTLRSPHPLCCLLLAGLTFGASADAAFRYSEGLRQDLARARDQLKQLDAEHREQGAQTLSPALHAAYTGTFREHNQLMQRMLDEIVAHGARNPRSRCTNPDPALRDKVRAHAEAGERYASLPLATEDNQRAAALHTQTLSTGTGALNAGVFGQALGCILEVPVAAPGDANH